MHNRRTPAALARGLAVALLLVLVSAPIGGLAIAQDQLPVLGVADLPEVLDMRVSTTGDRGRLILDLSGKTEFAIASLSEPDRIAIDIRSSALKVENKSPIAGTGLIGSYDAVVAEPGRVRTTLTIGSPAQVQQAYVLDAVGDEPARLVVDVIPDTPEGFAARVAADRAAAEANGGRNGVAAIPQPSQAAAQPAPAEGTKPLIVIDPGHGGIDNGASAPNGVHEKDIVLKFALDLQAALVKTGRFDIALTRADDTYLTLNDRVNLARQNKADLLISLHADTFQEPDIRGASIYTLDERGHDILDKVLAENEKRSDLVAGYTPPGTPPEVVNILVDLMRRQVRRQSYAAARTIIGDLQNAVELRRFPVRQADFFVLQAPDVPSVLIELGFLSNAADIANLQQSAWRDKVVAALAKGVADYFDQMSRPVAAAQ